MSSHLRILAREVTILPLRVLDKSNTYPERLWGAKDAAHKHIMAGFDPVFL